MEMQFALGICTGIAMTFLFYHFHIASNLESVLSELQNLRQKLNEKI